MRILQAAGLLCIGWGLVGVVGWATLGWIYPKARPIAYMLLLSAAAMALMWLSVIVSPFTDPTGSWPWSEALATAPYWLYLTLVFTTILFGPIALLRWALPCRWKWVSLVVGIPPALIWSLGFYVYVIWVFAANLGMCLPPGRVYPDEGCRLMP